jgi:hypothetical protein
MGAMRNISLWCPAVITEVATAVEVATTVMDHQVVGAEAVDGQELAAVVMVEAVEDMEEVIVTDHLVEADMAEAVEVVGGTGDL